MKKLLCLLFAAFLLCVSASALELPSGLDDVVPRELIDNAETGNDLLLRGGQYLFSHFRAALQDAVANSLRGAMALMLLSLLCGLIEGTAESAGETPARYAGYLGVLGAVALSAGDLSALIGLGVETMDELSTMAKLLLPTIAAAMAGGGCVGSASVWQVGALMLSDIFLSLMCDVLVPVLYCMIGTAAAGALLEQSRLSLLSKGIGKLLSWGLSAILIVFTAFLSVSNLLAGSADRLAVKVGKTVISGAVPVVGGILSDATEARRRHGAHAARDARCAGRIFGAGAVPCAAAAHGGAVSFLSARGVFQRHGGVTITQQVFRAALLRVFTDAGDDGGRGVLAARVAFDCNDDGGDGMTFLRSWLLSVTACAVLISIVQQLTDGGTMKKIVRFVGGMVLMLAMLRPLLSLTFDLPELDGGHYCEAVEALKQTLNAEQDSALGDSIAAQTQAYIEDKASSLGLSVRAEVQTALRDGVPFPDSVTLYGENSAALGAYIVQELGIAEENQLWIEPK